MKRVDSINQIIDLEYFLHQDVTQQPEILHQRDRAIALELGAEKKDLPSDSELLSGWVENRREDEFPDGSIDSPGTIFEKSKSIATTLFGIKGLVTGILTGAAFFAYAGTTPINVLQFLIFFVFSQLVLVGILLSTLLLRRLIPGIKLPSTSFSLILALGRKLFNYLHRSWFSDLPADKREASLHAFGIMRRGNRLYGDLYYWPLFKLNQIFGISFNLGLLSSCLLKIVTSDLAFGWQSTLQISSAGLEKLVQALATPWSWLFPSTIPTFEQIEGSRIILKDGIYHLSTADLVAWWPFLILCLVVYGLLMRVFFFLLALLMEKRSLRNQRFHSSQCQILIRRMRAPLVTTQAAPEDKRQETAIASEPPITKEKEEPGKGQVVLVPDDIFHSLPADYLQKLLQQRGSTLTTYYRFMAGYEEDRTLLKTLLETDWSETSGVYIIMEGWMVPLVDFLTYLQALRNIAGPETTIEIGLTGKLKDDKITKVRQSDMDIWRKKVGALGDPFTELFAIAGIDQ